MTWIQTHTGRAFDLLAPRAEDVDIADIAHALSRINRFSGHTHGEPYSVAHHSMLVADLLASWGAPPAIVREGLLHDASEAYYGDVTSPVKRALDALRDVAMARAGEAPGHTRVVLANLHALTDSIDRVVRSALMLPEHETPLVKRADLVALAIERRDLFGGIEEPRDWALPEFAPILAVCGRPHGRVPADYTRLVPMHLCSWSSARDAFTALMRELDAQIGASS